MWGPLEREGAAGHRDGAGKQGGGQTCTKLVAYSAGKAQAPEGKAESGECLGLSPSAPGARPAGC